MQYSITAKVFYFIVSAFFIFFLFNFWGIPSVLAAVTAAIVCSPYLYRKNLLIFISVFAIIVFLFGTILLNSHNIKVPLVRILHNKPLPRNILRTISSYLIVLVCSIMGATFRFVISRLQREKEIQKLQKEKLEAELKFLRAQINPHFLFNSLNTIYYQIDKNNQTARETLTKFSELLRYQLYHNEEQNVDLGKEAEVIENYIELQKLRMNNNYQIHYRKIGIMEGFKISPLLLIPLVENSFKHVSHFTDRSNYISFVLKRENNSFTFHARNSVETTPNLNDKPHREDGIGLKNVRRRLQLLYPKNHSLVMKRETQSFEIQLLIQYP